MSVHTFFSKSMRSWLALVLVFFTSTAAQSSEKELAAALLETTGVALHLENASLAIFSDALPQYSQCFVDKNGAMRKADEQKFNAQIEQHFGGAVVVPRAINSLSDAMTTQDLQAVQAFFNSPIGARIVAAEAASKDYDEKTFNRLMDRHLNSQTWDDNRQALVESVYDSTQAARFVSTINGEILVASTLGGHCDNSAEGIEELQPLLDTLRSESKFIEPFMRDELVRLVATVFRNIPNTDLAAYAEFASSELGKAFFNALLASTASSLSEGVSELTLSIQQ